MDEIGDWSVKKLEIIKKYSGAYSGLIRKNGGKYFESIAFIDGFAGQGLHYLREKKENPDSLFPATEKKERRVIDGSPLIAIRNNFDEFHFVDIKKKNIDELKECISELEKPVSFYNEDANVVLPGIFKNLKAKYRSWRGLCLLDPFGAHINWSTIQAAGDIGKMLDLIIHFSIRDIQGNGMPNEKEDLTEDQRKRFDIFFGDPSWLDFVYDDMGVDFFGRKIHKKRIDAEKRIIDFYIYNLSVKAKFNFVNISEPFINSTGGRQYYLIFASHNKRGDEKAKEVIGNLNKYG